MSDGEICSGFAGEMPGMVNARLTAVRFGIAFGYRADQSVSSSSG